MLRCTLTKLIIMIRTGGDGEDLHYTTLRCGGRNEWWWWVPKHCAKLHKWRTMPKLMFNVTNHRGRIIEDGARVRKVAPGVSVEL